MIKGEDIDDAGNTMEEIEANAFAGLLLMSAEDIRQSNGFHEYETQST